MKFVWPDMDAQAWSRSGACVQCIPTPCSGLGLAGHDGLGYFVVARTSAAPVPSLGAGVACLGLDEPGHPPVTCS